MKKVSTIGLDLAKNIFHVHAVDENGKMLFRKKLSRNNVLEFFSNTPRCLVGMEASCGSSYWARKIGNLGHQAKQISPQFVTPYVKTNKNDFNDAEAICEAVSRPNMRFIPMKNQEQRDIQALHRIRERLVSHRTATANQARSLLLENGISIPQGISNIRKQLPYHCEDLNNELSLIARDYLSDLYTQLADLDTKIEKYQHLLSILAKTSEVCQRLMKIRGVGILTATAVVASAGDGSEFKNGRHLAAWIGLVPKQHSSGGKTVLRGISKRGDPYLRKLLIQGAHNLLRYCKGRSDKRSLWLQSLMERKGKRKAAVAQANKTARIIWSLLTTNEEYKESFC